jgi:two-component system phosphate regulon sensor histidine kinase PhoR
MKRLWNNSLVAKVFLSYLAVVALLFAGFYFFSNKLIRQLYIDTLSGRMEQEAHLLSQVLPYDIAGAELDARCRQLAGEIGSRITVIDLDGKVLGDSGETSAQMENHATRPEVIEAKQSGSGGAIRHSATVGYDMLYRAFYQTGAQQARIVRVAMPLKDVEGVIQSIRYSLLSGLLLASSAGLFLAWWLSRQFSRRIQRLVEFTSKITAGTFPQEFFPTNSRDGIAVLERHLNEMSAKIRSDIQEIVGEKDKSESILRCMIEGVLVLDPKGQVMVINDQAKSMFHTLAGRDLHGVSVLELSRHPEMHAILQQVLKLNFTSESFSKEVELEDARWFSINAVPLRTTLGMSLGSIMVFHDITDIKRLETIRADFVANVSHELRTPLTAIRGYVETLLHMAPENIADRQQFLTIIERNSERLSRLTEDLLTLSDLESGKVRLVLQAVKPLQLIKRVLEVFWDQAAKKKIKLEQEVSADLPPLLGDPDRLQQLLINLVDNALKYTPAGGKITLRASVVDHDHEASRQIEITVTDTGTGIPEKDLPRLTERFYRVDKARSRDLGGTGLGLAIVKHIVQAHKGELKIASVVNQGTSVRVRLPIAQVETAPQAILFLCAGNSCRSQMAEGFARQLANGKYRIFSAGTTPKGIHPLAARVMEEVGFDISSQSSKGLDDVPLDKIDRLVTLCGDADEHCPTIGGQVTRLHWPIPDPAAAEGSEEQVLPLFRQVRDEIHQRVQALLA